MNPVRVQYIRETLASVHSKEQEPVLNQLKGLRMLDIGCGGGLLSESLARLGGSVTAIDPSEINIAVAKDHSSRDSLTSSIDYQATTVQEFSKTSPQQFDVICALEVT
jgi:ubiquinone biosynthesis O-methyltransferase